MRIFTKLFTVALLLAASLTVSAQGVTTASIFGKLTDQKTGEALIGATVQAVHTPSGTSYGNVTDLDGFFRLPGMRVGGPYIVTLSYTGYEPIVQDGIYLQLGQAFQFSKKMGVDAIILTGVEVISSRSDIFNGEKTGQETNVGEEAINALPTISRSIGDFTRLTPQSTTSEGNDGLELSFGGINNRYNAIFIDGAVSNDVFGLSGSGTNGGQTGVSPISVDAIESFQINLAPYDVTQGGFAGASISAITRSGSNNTEASVYGFFRNQSLLRKELDGAEIDDFSAYTAGFRLGGAIVKDKLFYFVNYERQDETTPRPFNPDNYVGDATTADINQLVSFLGSEYGYEPGTYIDNEQFLVSNKLNAKFDYNLNDKNKLSLRLSYVGADNLEGVQSNNNNINFLNGSERFDAKTYGAALEVNTIIGSNMSNNFILGVTLQRDDRDPNGEPFPWVQIEDGSGNLTFGSERFSTANLLNQDVITLTNNFEIFKGKHTYTIGANLELYKSDNLFLAYNYGQYQFDDLATFLDGGEASFFQRVYSLRDNVSGDDSQAIASFGAGQAGLYFQDRIQIADNFSLTAGLRFDLPFYDDTPVNPDLNENFLSQIESEYDIRGAQSGSFIKPNLLISPRVGFNWDILGDKTTQARGGVGVFTSRSPLVWVGGAFNNYGLNAGYTRSFNATFNPDINGQLPGNIDPNNVTPSGAIDLFAEDFKLPQVLKMSLAVDRKLPYGFIGTLDVLYNKTLQNVAYQNLNIGAPTDQLDGPDNRNYFGNGDDAPVAGGDNYGRVVLGYNTNEGYGYNLTASLKRPFSNGFFVQASYSYGDAYSVFDGTSSQNSSQWRGLHNVNGRNIDQQLYRSNFAAGSRFLGVVSKRFEYGASNKFATTITMISETAQGSPYSLIYNDNGNLTGRTDSRERSLIYIPANMAEMNFVDETFSGVDYSAAQQAEAFEAFLSTNDYTSSRRGQYAERNGDRGPWSTVVDLKFVQDIPLAGKNRLQVTFDALNFTNLLSEKWGRRQFLFSDYQVVNFEGFEDNSLTPTYSFNPALLNEDNELEPFLDDTGLQSSRFQGQIGIRYIFE
jgi:YD repeat-containing protein